MEREEKTGEVTIPTPDQQGTRETDPYQDILEMAYNKVADAADGSEVKCPKCGESFRVKTSAVFKDTSITMELTVQEGHILQASTLGETIVNFQKLMKAAAKHLGVKLEVFVTDLKISEQRVSIKFQNVAIAIDGKRHSHEQAR